MIVIIFAFDYDSFPLFPVNLYQIVKFLFKLALLSMIFNICGFNLWAIFATKAFMSVLKHFVTRPPFHKHLFSSFNHHLFTLFTLVIHVIVFFFSLYWQWRIILRLVRSCVSAETFAQSYNFFKSLSWFAFFTKIICLSH